MSGRILIWSWMSKAIILVKHISRRMSSADVFTWRRMLGVDFNLEVDVGGGF
jgi:hypothetical protein